MKMIIGGNEKNASNGMTIDVYNPYTGEKLDMVPCATQEDVEEAIENARDGFKRWSAVPLCSRIEILQRFSNLLKDKKEELLDLMISESGKCISNADGEIDEAIVVFQTYCEKARNLGGEILPTNTEERSLDDLLMVVRQPLGVIACVTPFNFPVELFAHKVAPALVTGNSVIIKPSSSTPLTSIYLAKLLLEAGVEPNAIQVITGYGEKIGRWLTESGKIDALSLTGSLNAGGKIMAGCAKHITRCMLELGGNDPLIVMADCDLDAAVEAAVGGRCWNAGQTCNACKRFIVDNQIVGAFTEKLINALKAIKLGDPRDPETVYGTLIDEKAVQKVIEQVNHTIEQGAVCALNEGLIGNTIMRPIVLTGVTKDMDIAKDLEVFGPVWPVIGFDSIEEALEIANQSFYGLSSGVFTKDLLCGIKVAYALETGACVVNGNGCYRTAHEPYGGHKRSGIGVEGVSHTLEELTQMKTIVLPKLFK